MSSRMPVVSFVLLSVSALSATVLFGADMISGTWKENLGKSTYSPGPPPKGPNSVQFTAVDNGLRVVLNGVNAAGQKTHVEYTVRFDGKDYPVARTLDGKPVENVAGETASAKKVDDYTFEFTVARKGRVPGLTRLVVSKDGKTHTATQTGATAQGQPIANTIILEKQ
jgi:hypothetical protein